MEIIIFLTYKRIDTTILLYMYKLMCIKIFRYNCYKLYEKHIRNTVSINSTSIWLITFNNYIGTKCWRYTNHRHRHRHRRREQKDRSPPKSWLRSCWSWHRPGDRTRHCWRRPENWTEFSLARVGLLRMVWLSMTGETIWIACAFF